MKRQRKQRVVRTDSVFRTKMNVCRRAIIESALHASDGNRSEAARRLGITRAYVHMLIRSLGIKMPRAR